MTLLSRWHLYLSRFSHANVQRFCITLLSHMPTDDTSLSLSCPGLSIFPIFLYVYVFIVLPISLLLFRVYSGHSQYQHRVQRSKYHHRILFLFLISFMACDPKCSLFLAIPLLNDTAVSFTLYGSISLRLSISSWTWLQHRLWVHTWPTHHWVHRLGSLPQQEHRQ